MSWGSRRQPPYVVAHKENMVLIFRLARSMLVAGAEDARSDIMNVGDYVFVTATGELRFEPGERQEQAGEQIAQDGERFVGRIQQVAPDPEDTIVAIEPPTENTAPGRSTIRTLREMYG
jgi:hypothetical protein